MTDKKIEENIKPIDDDSVVMMPPLEENIPLPKSATEALPELTN